IDSGRRFPSAFGGRQPQLSSMSAFLSVIARLRQIAPLDAFSCRKGHLLHVKKIDRSLPRALSPLCGERPPVGPFGRLPPANLPGCCPSCLLAAAPATGPPPPRRLAAPPA